MADNLIYPALAGATLVLCAAFCLYLLTRAVRERGRRSLAILAAALFFTAGVEATNVLAVLFPAKHHAWLNAALVLEGLMWPAWLLFSMRFARKREQGRAGVVRNPWLWLACLLPVGAAYLAYGGYYYSPDFGSEKLLFLGPGAFFFYLGGVLCAVMGLFNLEGTMLRASHHRRWKIKFMLLGAGTVLGTHVLYYSQALTNRTVELGLAPARCLALALGVGLMWYSLVRAGEQVRIHVSRHVVNRSLVLAVAGAYLVVLGLAGEGARWLGEDFGPAVLLFLGIVTGVGLVVVSLSERIQRKTRRFLRRNFSREKYDYRQQWLTFTGKLNAARNREDLYQAVLLAWCETFGARGAVLFLLDHGKGVWEPASWMEMRRPDSGFDSELPLVGRMRRTGRAVEVDRDEAHTPPALSRYLEASGATYAAPLFREGELDGFVLMGPGVDPGERYDGEDLELMEAMGHHVASALTNMRLSDQLARAREMEVVGKVSTFVAHDLKNLVYTLSLVVGNAGKHIGNLDFQRDMLDSLTGTVDKMKILISKLKGLPERQTLQREEVGLLSLAREAAEIVAQSRVHVDGRDVRAWVDRQEMGKVVVNLYLNAVDATRNGGDIRVEAGEDHGPFLRVADTGEGMDEAFVRRGLFVPFKTTKKGGMGIGLYQCKQIVEAHGGRIEVESKPGQGTAFTVRLSSNGSPANRIQREEGHETTARD